MSGKQYLTAPDPTETGWPKGVKYIIGNEGCERFSYYGMKAILYVYLTVLMKEHGMFEGDELKNQATHVVHLFGAGVYALPLVGAIVADRLVGKYHTILWLSIVYCLGHLCLALFESNYQGFMVGLILIAVGSGGIKPCVSAHVGDQFGEGNWDKLRTVYFAFYFIINFGSFFSTLLTPWLLEHYGPSWAFGVPGILMALATVAFWMGRHVFVHVPAAPGGKLGLLDAISGTLLFFTIGSLMFFGSLNETYAEFPVAVKLGISAAFLIAGLVVFNVRQKMQPDDGFLAVLIYSLKVKFVGEGHQLLMAPAGEAIAATGDPSSTGPTKDRNNLSEHSFWGPAVKRFGVEAAEGPWAVIKIVTVFMMVSIFWALFDQHGSSWIRQAETMDRTFNIFGTEFEVLAAQVPSVNPILVMLLIPFFVYVGYPALEKVLRVEMTPLRRMTIGMFIAAFSFVIVALIQGKLDSGESVHVGYQLLAYLVITIAEVMVSITGLEFAYSQAPKRMKSTIMGFWLLGVSLGNVLVAWMSTYDALMNQPLANFFWTFAGLMAVAAVLFGLRASFYTYQDYSQ